MKTFKYNYCLLSGMKKGMIVLFTSVMLIIIAGCGFLPEKPGIEDAGEPVLEEPVQEQAEPEPATDKSVEEVVEEEELVVAVEDITAETDMTDGLPEISGSLDLQDNLGLCPHLAESFECNKYDVRRCDFKTFVGQNGYYPDLISCRSGYENKGEDTENKYCLIQECRPLEKENIVYAYGGPVIYAEYDYSVESVEGGIMTHYSLLRCGETYNEFDTSFDCRVYKSELEDIWGD